MKKVIIDGVEYIPVHTPEVKGKERLEGWIKGRSLYQDTYAKITKEMNFLVCPICEHIFDSDEMYDSNAYHKGEHEVKCPLCKESFHMNVITCFRYKTLTVDEYFEEGGF